MQTRDWWNRSNIINNNESDKLIDSEWDKPQKKKFFSLIWRRCRLIAGPQFIENYLTHWSVVNAMASLFQTVVTE